MLIYFGGVNSYCINYRNNINREINKNNYNIQMKVFDKGNLVESDICNKIFDIKIIEDKRLGQYIVEKISSTLPSVDNIGHKVLHLNNEFINYILDNTMIDYSLKKEIILYSIKISQAGDNMGSNLLELYYNIVEKLL